MEEPEFAAALALARAASMATASARATIDTQNDRERLERAKAALTTRPLSERELDAVRVGYYTAAIHHRAELIGHAEGMRNGFMLLGHDTAHCCAHCVGLQMADALDDLIAHVRNLTTGDLTQ